MVPFLMIFLGDFLMTIYMFLVPQPLQGAAADREQAHHLAAVEQPGGFLFPPFRIVLPHMGGDFLDAPYDVLVGGAFHRDDFHFSICFNRW